MINVCIGDRIEWRDAHEEFSEIRNWAKKNCKSFTEMKITDVSDVSMLYDYVAQYSFNDDRDATLFRLRWS